MAPFRSAAGGEVLTSPTARGVLSLEVAPRHVALHLADLQLAIADGAMVVSRTVRRGVRRMVAPIRGRLVMARGLPREALGLWHETTPDTVERVFGAEPRDLISDDGLSSLRQLDRLARRLGQAIAEHGRGTRSAVEVGPPGAGGLDKVLLIDLGDRLIVYRRSLFRTRARRILEARADGTVTVVDRARERTFVCRSRFAVSVLGDYLRLGTGRGPDERVALPWISREDRDELARRIGEVIERDVAIAR